MKASHGRKMNPFQIQKKEIKLILNKSIYPDNIIAAALNDFKNLCAHEIKGEILVLKPRIETDSCILVGEFYNYLLSLIKA